MGNIEYIYPEKSTDFGMKSKHPMPIYIQFVPGIVLDVIVNSESSAYNGPRDINAIVAKPHYGASNSFKILNKKKYYPLFRGVVDVPTIGDQVLLCDFGDVDYYLGPLNTTNNPNFNIDHLNKTDPNIKNTDKYKSKATGRDIVGLSKSFPLLPVARLQKKFKNKLDHLSNKKRKDIKETHGDIVLEGRHGNSLRIGSRDLYPNIVKKIDKISDSISLILGNSLKGIKGNEVRPIGLIKN